MCREHEVGNVRSLGKEEGIISSLGVRGVAGQKWARVSLQGELVPHTEALYRLLNTRQVLGDFILIACCSL